ncbi:lysophospholipase [Daedaleopsis nitida]|nr:lysophospholipase [Daedaleopsis nitida]
MFISRTCISNRIMAIDLSSFTEAWLEGPYGHKSYTRTYPAPTAPEAILVYVHGFADHISRYEDVHSIFSQQGITVFAYDLRGFGRTALDKQNRSPGEYYGKTSRLLEFGDLEHWIRYVSRTYPGLSIFVLGYSAGGGMVLAFATHTGSPRSTETLSIISGVIAQAPLVALTHSPLKLVTLAVRVISSVLPSFPIPTPGPEERFPHDAKAVEALANDTLRMPQGTALGLYDMIAQGEELLAERYKRWPKDLPMLTAWGTADEVNCPKAGVAFFDRVEIEDKKLLVYNGAFHDLLHEAGDLPSRVTKDYIAWIKAHLHVRSPGA